MKTVQFIFLLALVSAPAWGGNTKVDSLKQLLEQHSTADKAEVLWGIAYELFDVDNAEALFYADRAYHEVWKRGDSLQIVKVGTTYGQLLRRMGKVDRSIEISSKMLPIAKRHEYRKYWKMVLNSLGLAHAYKREYARSLDFAYQSLILRREDGDSLEIAMALLNLGYIHVKLDELDEGEIVTKEANTIFTRLENGIEHLIIGTVNLGVIEYTRRKYDSAIRLHHLALRLAEQTGILAHVPQIHQSIAHCYLAVRDIDSAKYFGELAVSQARKTNYLWAMFYGHIALTKVALVNGDPQVARLHLNKADSIARTADFPELHVDIVIPRIQVLLANREYDEATKLFNEYILDRDSLDYSKNFTQVRRHQISFAQRENEAKIRAQTSIMGSQEKFIQRQWLYVITVTFLIGIVAVLAIALYRAYGRIKHINTQLDARIIERTVELATQRDVLQHHIRQEQLIKTRISAELYSLSSSLNGLIRLAMIDNKDNAKIYFDRSIELTNRIVALGAKLLGKGVLGNTE